MRGPKRRQGTVRTDGGVDCIAMTDDMVKFVSSVSKVHIDFVQQQ